MLVTMNSNFDTALLEKGLMQFWFADAVVRDTFFGFGVVDAFINRVVMQEHRVHASACLEAQPGQGSIRLQNKPSQVDRGMTIPRQYDQFLLMNN